MEAIVKRRFRCKITKQKFFPGQSYEGSPERIEELKKAGYLEGAPLPALKTAPKKAAIAAKEEMPPAAADKNAYELMTKKELEKMLDQRGIEYTKRQPKAELIELLLKED